MRRHTTSKIRLFFSPKVLNYYTYSYMSSTYPTDPHNKFKVVHGGFLFTRNGNFKLESSLSYSYLYR